MRSVLHRSPRSLFVDHNTKFRSAITLISRLKPTKQHPLYRSFLKIKVRDLVKRAYMSETAAPPDMSEQEASELPFSNSPALKFKVSSHKSTDGA